MKKQNSQPYSCALPSCKIQFYVKRSSPKSSTEGTVLFSALSVVSLIVSPGHQSPTVKLFSLLELRLLPWFPAFFRTEILIVGHSSTEGSKFISLMRSCFASVSSTSCVGRYHGISVRTGLASNFKKIAFCLSSISLGSVSVPRHWQRSLRNHCFALLEKAKN